MRKSNEQLLIKETKCHKIFFRYWFDVWRQRKSKQVISLFCNLFTEWPKKGIIQFRIKHFNRSQGLLKNKIWFCESWSHDFQFALLNIFFFFSFSFSTQNCNSLFIKLSSSRFIYLAMLIWLMPCVCVCLYTFCSAWNVETLNGIYRRI